MTDDDMVTGVSTPGVPPGWFVDPCDPSRMRWWTGSSWSEKTHRPARTWGIYPAAYIQSFWIGMNRAALLARIFATVGFVALLLVGIAVPISAASPTTVGSTLLVMLLTLSGIASPIGLVFAIVALRRSRTLGAFGISVWAIVVSSIPTAIAGVWLIGWVGLGIAGAVSS
jgi:hypothetical protein